MKARLATEVVKALPCSILMTGSSMSLLEIDLMIFTANPLNPRRADCQFASVHGAIPRSLNCHAGGFGYHHDPNGNKHEQTHLHPNDEKRKNNDDHGVIDTTMVDKTCIGINRIGIRCFLPQDPTSLASTFSFHCE